MKLLSLLPNKVTQLIRRCLLHYSKSLDYERLMARALKRALQAARQAARHSEAYRTLLQEHQLDPAYLGADTALSALPVLTKKNTFERFTLAQLSRPHACHDLADVLTSSGRSGRSFGFKLTTREEQASAWFDIDLGLQEMFKIDQLDTLLINCLPMGVTVSSRAVTVANVSVREDMACALLRDLGPRFQQTLLCTDPLFIRPLLDEARRLGLDWAALNTSVIIGEEVLVEAQRDYLAGKMGIDLSGDTHRLIGSSYGVGELGLNLLFETRETIQIRRAMRTQSEVAQCLIQANATATPPCVFCFNPMHCHVEVLNPDRHGFGEICITLLSPRTLIALPRYATGDRGRMVSRSEATRAAALAGTARPWLPLVALSGRLKDRPVGLPSVEDIKTLIYFDPWLANQLTGAFHLASEAQGHPQLTVQARSEQAAQSPALKAQLALLMPRFFPVPLTLEIARPGSFPRRPILDFERKFPYVD